METLGGLNAKPGGSSVTDEPLEEKDVLFSPDLWLNFKERDNFELS